MCYCSKEKHHQRKLQCTITSMGASEVFALVHGGKNTTSTSRTVSRPSWAQVYRSGMQQPNAGSTRARSAGGALVQAAFGIFVWW